MSQISARIKRRSSVTPAMWLVAFLLAIIAGCLLVEVGIGAASANQLSTSAAANGSLLAIAGQLSRDSYGLYLVDQQNSTICVYQWMPGTRKIYLRAARTYAFDRKLDEFNTEPSPKEIKEMVDKARRLDKNGSSP